MGINNAINSNQTLGTGSSPTFASIKLTTGATNNYFLKSDASGNATWAPLSSSAVTSAQGTSPILVNGTSSSPQTGNITISAAAATTSALGVASFSATNFSVSAGAVDTIQNINTSASPTFLGLNLSGLTASRAIVTDASKNLTSLAYTSSNTASTIVSRDTSGNFSAGLISATSLALNGSSVSSALLTMTSTTQGFLPPVMTTTQRNNISSPSTGLIIYNSINLDIEAYNGSSWVGSSLSGVTSLQGSANQVLVNGTTTAQSGACILTLPQSIATSSAVQFDSLGLGIAPGNVAFGTAKFLTSFSANKTFFIDSPIVFSEGVALNSTNTSNNANKPLEFNASSYNFRVGNVGINQSNPGSLLSISGNVSIGSLATTAAPTNGVIISGSVFLGSGTRLVTNSQLEVQGGYTWIGGYSTTSTPSTTATGGTSISWNKSAANGEINFYNTYSGTQTDAYDFWSWNSTTSAYQKLLILSRQTNLSSKLTLPNTNSGMQGGSIYNDATYDLVLETGSSTKPLSISASYVYLPNSMTIGNSTPTTSALLTLSSTSKGFLPPSMTTTQKNAISSPASGLIVFDNVLLDLFFYNGTSWVGSSLSGVTSVSGTTSRITCSPTTGAVIVDISSSYVGQSTITTLGTITSGTWNGTAINLSSYASGTLQAAQFPALTGDLTTSAGSLATTLATVNSNVGTFGSLTQIGTFTVNAKGLITAASNVSLASAAITSLTGTANQVLVNGVTTAQVGACTLTLPQSIATSSAVQFGTLGLGMAISGAFGTAPLVVKTSSGSSNKCFYVSQPIVFSEGIALNSVNDSNAANKPMEFNASAFNFRAGNIGLNQSNPVNLLDVNGSIGVGSFSGSVTLPSNSQGISGQLIVGGSTASTAKIAITDSSHDTTNYGQTLQITRAATGAGQYAAFVRAGNNIASIGYLPGNPVFGFGSGTSTDSGFSPNILSMNLSTNTVFVGATSAVSTEKMLISPVYTSNRHGLYLGGSVATSGNTSTGIYVGTSLGSNGAFAGTTAGILIDTTVDNRGQTVGAHFALRIQAGTFNTTVAATYSAFISQPSAGTVRCALASDDFQIGYQANNMTVGNGILSGCLSIGSSTQNVSKLLIEGDNVISSLASFGNSAAWNPTSTSANAVLISPLVGTANGASSFSFLKIQPNFDSDYSLATAYGFYIGKGTEAGTPASVAKMYSAYFDTQDITSGFSYALGLNGSMHFKHVETSTNYSCVAQENFIGANTGAGAITVTLPATLPNAGYPIIIYDRGNNATINNITIARNGNTINGLAANLLISSNGGVYRLIAHSGGWNTW